MASRFIDSGRRCSVRKFVRSIMTGGKDIREFMDPRDRRLRLRGCRSVAFGSAKPQVAGDALRFRRDRAKNHRATSAGGAGNVRGKTVKAGGTEQREGKRFYCITLDAQ